MTINGRQIAERNMQRQESIIVSNNDDRGVRVTQAHSTTPALSPKIVRENHIQTCTTSIRTTLQQQGTNERHRGSPGNDMILVNCGD